MKRLSPEMLESLDVPELERPTAAMLALPEKVVQFGTGAFLRGFADYFIDEANRAGRFNGRIVAVSSTGSVREAALNDQRGLYTLAIRGAEKDEMRERFRVVGALSRVISAKDAWSAVLDVARDPSITLVVSNTTEVGFALDESDTIDSAPPRAFPAKLARFLVERARTFDCDPARGVVVLPCELLDDNGALLGELVLKLARAWSVGASVERWLETSVTFCNTLVDRIVPGALDSVEAARVTERLGYEDALLTACEPYALFAIEGDDALRARLEFPGDDPRIIVAPDIRPYRQRKVRVLNGGHTISMPAAMLAGFETVRESCDDERVGRFVRRAIFDDIVSSLDVPDAERFAGEVFGRFGNPFIRHALADIALYTTTKLRVRVIPSIMEYHARTGRAPASLSFGFAAYIAFMRGDLHASRAALGRPLPADPDGDRVRSVWQSLDVQSDEAVSRVARAVCSDVSLWGFDLTTVNGFADAVADHLVRIVRDGITTALDVHLTEPATT